MCAVIFCELINLTTRQTEEVRSIFILSIVGGFRTGKNVSGKQPYGNNCNLQR